MTWAALWGSFANVCIHRIPRHESLVRPASHCPHCQQPIAWYDNIPVVGFLLLRGHCRRCDAKISPRYLLIELCAIGLAALVYARFVIHADWGNERMEPAAMVLSRFLIYFFFVGVLLVLSAIDLEYKLLPDRITYPAIPVFFLLGRQCQDVSIGQAIGGLLMGYLAVRLISDGYYYLTGREGLGYGDGKLLSLIGALLGWQALPFTLLVASLAGLLVGTPLTLWKRRHSPEDLALRHIPIVFGPFLAIGATLYLLFFLGRDIDSWLLRVLATLLGEAV
jgi:leader peptidase (prepilin peptidase)/N-methyltransferase